MNDNKLVAVVNGKEISRQDVLKFLNDIGPQMAMQFQSPEGIKKVIDELVNQELLYLDAVETNIEEDQEFKDVLEATKINLLKDYAVNKIISDVDVSDEELIEFYEANKDSFNTPETVKASHILVDSEEKALEVTSEIDKGMSFEDAAMNYSTCPSKEAGGDLGEFTRGQMVPEFEDAAFNLIEGTISKPVKTQFGYHIIKVVSKSAESTSTFDDVKDQVFNQIMRQKQQNKYINKINDLKGIYKVEMF